MILQPEMAADCEVKTPTVLQSDCIDYFSSLGFLSRRILVEQEVLRSMSAWETLTDSEREQSLDNYFIQAEVQRRFEKKELELAADNVDNQKEKESYFPRYSIKSGEKIVVDFENPQGFSTWEDEHSGPFSWESKTQREENPFEIDLKSFKRKSKTPRERTQSGSEDKTYAFNPNKSIWDSPFLKADGANPLESSGFGDIFGDIGGLTLSPTIERCESPPLLETLQFDGEQVTESTNEELEAFCSKEALSSRSEVSSQQDDDGSSLGDYIEMAEPDPDPPVIKLKTPFSFRKKTKPPIESIMARRESAPHLPVTILQEPQVPQKVVPPYATAIILPRREQKKEPPKRDIHYPLYEPEPIPQPRVYRKEAPKKMPPQAAPAPQSSEDGEIYEPVMVSAGSAMAQPYEVVDLEQLNIESMPLPPEDDMNDNDANNEYYQSFDDSSALTKNELGVMNLDLDDLPPPILDFGDVITEQPGLSDSETLGLLGSPSSLSSTPLRSGFSFLDDW